MGIRQSLLWAGAQAGPIADEQRFSRVSLHRRGSCASAEGGLIAGWVTRNRLRHYVTLPRARTHTNSEADE